MKSYLSILQKRACFAFLLFLVCSFFSPAARSQSIDSKGTDFWLMFNSNFGTATLTVFITSDVSTSGTVSIPGLGFSTPFTVAANTVTPVSIPTAAASHTSNVIDNKGIHVTALQEVTVYGLNYIPFTTDAYLGLPTDALGTDYIVLTYSGQNASELGIVGTVNGTTVTVTPSVSTSGRTAGVPYNITLNQGQTYELGNATDISGTIITSTQPIGVMGANACANIPPAAVFCDHICEMLPPTTAWGKSFATVPLKARSNGDTWRFLAAQDGTIITINGVAQPAINRGQWVEKVLTTQSVITSNKPILTAQYANGSGFSGNPGDPFMMLIPPLEQFLPKYTVTTVSGYVAHYINIIAPNSIVGTLTFDGAAIPAGSFTAIGSTGFSGAQLTVAEGTHNLFGTQAFGVFMYGFNTDDSYGYPGGQSFSAVATVTSLTLSPKSGTAAVGTSKCFTGTVKDQFNNPVPGIRVDFAITGANPGQSGFAFTDGSGVATFCYAGANAGTDNITASVGSITDAGTFVWTPATSNIYYSKSSGDLHNVLTWGLNPDGSGANPADFNDSTFQLANRPSGLYIMTADWTVNGGTVNIPSGSQLQLNGFTFSISELAGTGTISGSGSSNLMVIGTNGGAIELNFTPAANMLNNFTVNRTGSAASAVLKNALNVLNVLTLTSGTLNTGGFLTLKSTASNTARVAPVTGAINGNVVVERYIPARRAWRIMAAPVSGSQTINQGWQEGAILGFSANPNPVPGYGTHITGGPTFGTVGNGFDQNPIPGAASSIKTYVNNTWQELPNTNVNLIGSTAYLLFVRGDRGIPLGYNDVPPTNTTLRATGSLKTGDQTYTVASTGFTAIPNPFASPINFATITRSGVQNNFYVWDPKLGGINGVGAYVLLSDDGIGGYTITPAPASPESQYIQSGQGFLVRPTTTGVSGSVTIKESDKSATAATDVFRVSSGAVTTAPKFVDPNSGQGWRITLKEPSSGASASLLDEVLVSYNSAYRASLDGYDAVKMENVQENLGMVRDGQTLMVERKPMPQDEDAIALRLWNTQAKAYLLEVNPVNLANTGMYARLEDKYLKVSMPVSLEGKSQFAFTVTNDPASARSDRFQLVLTHKLPNVLTQLSDKGGITAYPNPVSGQTINLAFANKKAGNYQVTMMTSSGQVILKKNIQYTGGSSQALKLPAKLAQGTYQLQIIGEDGISKISLVIN